MKLRGLAYEARCIGGFYYLVAKADEQGVVRLSVNECAKKFGTERTWVQRTIREMELRGIIAPIMRQKCTTLTICKYELYNTATAEVCAESAPIMRQSAASQEEKEGERERNVSPTPPSYKEKEKEREEVLMMMNTRTRENDENEREEIITDTAELYDLCRTTVFFNVEKDKKETFFDER